MISRLLIRYEARVGHKSDPHTFGSVTWLIKQPTLFIFYRLKEKQLWPVNDLKMIIKVFFLEFSEKFKIRSKQRKGMFIKLYAGEKEIL